MKINLCRECGILGMRDIPSGFMKVVCGKIVLTRADGQQFAIITAQIPNSRGKYEETTSNFICFWMPCKSVEDILDKEGHYNPTEELFIVHE